VDVHVDPLNTIGIGVGGCFTDADLGSRRAATNQRDQERGRNEGR
jgi:hypothetical protein